MQITYDPAKDEKNVAKHGISLERAVDMDFSAVLIRPDTRKDYGEKRYVAMAPIDGRLHVLIFTGRGKTMRIISLRKANARERTLYEQETVH